MHDMAWVIDGVRPDLVARAKSGDREAFDGLMDLYQRRVFALAYRMTGSADDARDVQQEAFIRAWTSLKSLRDENSFLPWVLRITSHLCMARTRRRKPVQSMEDLLVEPESREDLQANVLNRDLAALSLKTLQSLPAKHRLVIVLRLVEQRDFSEIAPVLNCSERGARTRFWRAAKVLRERLKVLLPEEEIKI